jgi:hypothetical protein
VNEPLFEWDPDKAQANLDKHGVSFEEAQTVFSDAMALTYVDRDHHEDRLVTLGISQTLRCLLVVSTERFENIRIISARKANPMERKAYDSQF